MKPSQNNWGWQWLQTYLNLCVSMTLKLSFALKLKTCCISNECLTSISIRFLGKNFSPRQKYVPLVSSCWFWSCTLSTRYEMISLSRSHCLVYLVCIYSDNISYLQEHSSAGDFIPLSASSTKSFFSRLLGAHQIYDAAAKRAASQRDSPTDFLYFNAYIPGKN